MSICTITNDCTTAAVGCDIIYTEVCTAAHPLTVFITPQYQAFYAKWLVVRGQEDALVREYEAAAARARMANVAFNVFIPTLAKQILVTTGGNLQHAAYLLYFGSRSPGAYRRLSLGSKLDRTKNWVESLKDSPHPVLAAEGANLSALIEKGRAASDETTAAEMALKAFRTIGARKELYDEFNVLRKDTFGKLDQLPHIHHELNLPLNFADGFFKHRPPAKEAPEPTLEDLRADLEAHNEVGKELQAKIDELEAEEKKAEDARKQAEADQVKIDEAKKQADESAAALAKLQAEFDKKHGG